MTATGSGWGPALRMARFETRRHKGRSALIAVLVGAAVFLLTGGLALYASFDIDRGEALVLRMGRGEALVTWGGGGQVLQPADGSPWYITGPAAPDAGAAAQSPAQSTAQPAATDQSRTIGRLLGRTPIATSSQFGRVVLGDRQRRAAVLYADGAEPTLTGKVSLTSGRWPAAATEVVVTSQAAAAGIPTTGTVTYSAGDAAPVRLTVVGTGTAYESPDTGGSAYDLIRPVSAMPATTGFDRATGSGEALAWVVPGPAPVTWPQVRALNTAGYHVTSRAVFLDPPTDLGLSPTDEQRLRDLSSGSGPSSVVNTAILLGAALIGETMLLAGPAFAVSAARQRRSLALLAGNGGTRTQVRRVVLGQAIVLGVGATLVAAALGVAAAGVGRAVAAVRSTAPVGPFEVPWLAVAVVVVTSIVGSIGAALVPSRGLGKLDLVALLRGQNVSPTLHRGMPVAGFVLFVAGVAGCAVAAFDPLNLAAQQQALVLAGGAVIAVLGLLFAVPLLLTVLGRLTERAPLSVRMATRDAARQRGRATPTIAAILGAAALASTLAIVVASDTTRRERAYTPSFAAGWGGIVDLVSAAPNRLATIERTVHSVAPELAVYLLGEAWYPEPSGTAPDNSAGSSGSGSGGDGTAATRVSALLRPGCTLEQSVLAAAPDVAPTDPQPCRTATTYAGRQDGAIAIADPAFLADALRLSDDERRLVTAGAAIVPDRAPRDTSRTSPMTDGRVTIASGTIGWSTDGRLGPVRQLRSVQLPGLLIDADRLDDALRGSQGPAYGLVVTTASAAKLGLPNRAAAILVHGADGSAVSPESEQRIDEAFGNSASVMVERGFQRDDRLFIWIAFGVVALLVLVAALVATAMSTAEGASTSATLAAVGATRTTRRKVAAAQAVSLAGLGAVLGLAVGAIPGISWALATTRSIFRVDNDRTEVIAGPFVTIPWPPIIALAVVVPVLAGAIAWVGIRRAPTMTRRLS